MTRKKDRQNLAQNNCRFSNQKIILVAAIIFNLFFLTSTILHADDFDRDMETEMSRQHVPGLAIAVVQHSKIVRLGAYGYANLEWKNRTTPHTRFEIASISKMFTGTAARILMEEGKLDPEDAVSKYINDVPESWKAIRVRHLITMSTGFDEDWGSDLIPYSAEVTAPANDADMLKMFFGMKPVADIGTEFHYSSPAYAMLGMIVSKISGEPLSKYINERIFQPAGMTESSFIDNWGIVPERAEGYRTKDGQTLKGWYLGQYLHARADVGILTTVEDFAKWIIALDQRKVVKHPEKLWEPTIADSGRPLDYNYGWNTDTFLGHRRLNHSGGFRTGFRTFVAKYPDDDLTIIAFTNCDFSDPGKFGLIATLQYLKELPDPRIESTKNDSDHAQTETLISAVRELADGKLNTTLMNSDALEPRGLAEISGLIKTTKSIVFAGRGNLSQALKIHNHALAKYETLKLSSEEGDYFLTAYYDDAGKIAYFELTP